jgi:uncharacterized RDD family membrane protein YckC
MSASRPRWVHSSVRKPVIVDQAPDSLQGYYAGFVSRAVAIVLDYVIIVLVTVIGLTALSLFLNLRSVQAFIRFLDGVLPGSLGFADSLLGPRFALLAGVVVYLLYFVFFFSTTGQTIGKALMGLRVVTMNGKRVGVRRAFVRTLCYPLSLAPFAFGFLWVLGQDRRQAWEDLIARTYVLYVWDARYEENFLRSAVYRLTRKREHKKAEESQSKQ